MQALRAWYARMDAYLLRIGFFKSSEGSNLYINVVKNEIVIIILYVDNLLLTDVEHRIQECKKMLGEKIEMKYLGLMYYYLGLEVWKKPGYTYISWSRKIYYQDSTKVWYDGF